MLNKKGGFWKVFIVILLIILIIAVLVTSGFIGYYFLTQDSSKRVGTSSNSGGGGLKNPTEGLSMEEAVAQFDEGFVYYLLINIRAYELHDPPLSNDHPKIEFYIENDIYNSEIVDRKINVRRGAIQEKDVIIRTTKQEAVLMVRDRNYVRESFVNGGSNIELVASKLRLATKGYLEIYEELS